MRIWSWNMAAAFGFDPQKHERAWALLAERAPDFALLQETIPPHDVLDVWRSVVMAPKSTRHPWGSAVIARSSIMDAFVPTASSPWLETLWGAVILARVDGTGLWLCSMHSGAYKVTAADLARHPYDGIRRCDPTDVWEVELVAGELANVFGSDRFVFGGDLNSALLFDTSYRRDSNARLFANLAEAGFADLRRGSFDAEQQTYFKLGKGNYQLDHVFADPSTAGLKSSWRVLEDVATTLQLSDHAPVEIEIDG